MKILKIKKGFITNSSGSYEWLPGANNSPAGNISNAPPVALPSTPRTNNNISNTPVKNGIPKTGLDPDVIALAAVLGFIIILISTAKAAKTVVKKLFGPKK